MKVMTIKAAMIGLGCLWLTGCQPTEAPNQTMDLFDLEAYLNEQAEAEHVLLNAQLISDGNTRSDTLYFDRYEVDSVIRIVRGFQYSRKERAGHFDSETIERGKAMCQTWQPELASDVLHMTVCRQNGQVVSLEGAKVTNSILNVLQQSYVWEITQSFQLKSTFVDKINKDTLNTNSLLTWKSIQ